MIYKNKRLKVNYNSDMDNMKKCIKCDQIKGLEDFPINKKSNSGYSNSCRECKNKYLTNRDIKRNINDGSYKT